MATDTGNLSTADIERRPALLMILSAHLETSFDGIQIELHEDERKVWATINSSRLDLVCTVNIIGEGAVFESQDLKNPLWARSGIEDYAEHASILRRWFDRAKIR